MPNSNIIKFKNDFASAEIVLLSDNQARLRSVYSTKRSRGYASDLMDEIVGYAESHGLDLYLVVQRFGRPAKGLDNEQLEKFYSNFGFKKLSNQGKFTMMIRHRSHKKHAL